MSWFKQQVQAALEGIKQLKSAPTATIVTCAVIGITLALPTTLRIALDNTERLNHYLKQTAKITVYLKTNTAAHTAQQIARSLKKRKDINTLQIISPKLGLQQLEQTTGIRPNSVSLANNPIPWVLIVKPAATKNPSKTFLQLQAFLTNLPQTDFIQTDTKWVTRLSAIIKASQSITIALTALLAAGVLFTTGNTIWAAIRRHAHEINIIRLMGGTRQFIRRPFLYAGALYGVLGASFAWFLITLLGHALFDPIQQLANLYKHTFSLSGLSITQGLYLLSGGALLGLVGAWFAVTSYLKAPETHC